MAVYFPFIPARCRLAHVNFFRIFLVLVVIIMIILALVLGLVFGLASRSKGDSTTNIALTVDLGYSQYKGANAKNGVSEWFGIRYAAPPLNELRFRAPQDPLTNTTLQDATTHGPICISTPSSSLAAGHSEDCLFLDVYAPTTATGLHPVFVWFCGGGFNSLGDPNRNGNSLINAADHDAVVVTFNYRVGLWGFLASKEVKENGDLNVGLLDQRKVLDWIQKYIHLFGGDPNHVTIGGASAGGASVDLQLTAYGGRDDGLFHAAAGESQSFGTQLTVNQSQYQYDALVKRVNCDTATDTLKCLRDLDIQTLVEHNINIPTPGGAGGSPLYMYSNTMDGNFTPDYSYNLYQNGKFVKVPAIFGDVTNEGTTFAPKSIANYSQMNNFLKNNFMKLNTTELDQIDKFYPKAQEYPNSAPYWRTAANAYGEMRYICPGMFVSAAFPRYGVNASYNYHWDVLSAANNASGLGVPHTDESDSIWGSSTAPGSALIPSIQGYWASFIRSKDPNTYKQSTDPEWKTYSANNMQRIYFPNDPSQVAMEDVPADQKARCAYFNSIGARVSQ